MAACICPFLLSCLWEPVQATLSSFLGTALGDSLSSLREWGMSRLRNLTMFWGHQVEQVPTSSGDLVGMGTIRGHMQQIGGYLKDETVRVIGIYGMGGVGKTTLLEMINNKFHEIGGPPFEVVIWVTVSRDADILRIQKSIGDRFQLSLSAEETAGPSSLAKEQADGIFRALSKRRFLLLLDDVWEKLDLNLVGVPQPTAENKCKIILTTRSKQVCHQMGAKKLVNVEVLNSSESWELFKQKAGNEVDLENPSIKPIAEAVAGKCGGLPLALKTVGCAMAEAHSVPEWNIALAQLKKSPQKLDGMEVDVLSPLRFSFDRLRDDSTKDCLLYCCLFPEDYKIPEKEVIDYWVAEGFLDDGESNSIMEARGRGHGVITRLKSACLLESAGGSCVKMHDVVQEMCLWLTGGENDEHNTFLVYAGRKDLNPVPILGNWGDAKRISLMGSVLQGRLRDVPPSPNLQTLLCYATRLHDIHQGFFESVSNLRVLDLSFTGLHELPDEIGFLGNLRYLSLRGMYIKSLPKGLAKLANLSMLDLDYTQDLCSIHQEAIPTLTGLQALGLYDSACNFLWPNELSGSLLDDNGCIQMEGTSSSSAQVSLKNKRSSWDILEELRLSVSTFSSLETLLSFDKLRQCTTDLKIKAKYPSDITSAHLSIALERLEKLQSLTVFGGRLLEEAEFNSGSKFYSSLERLQLNSIPQITFAVTSPPLFVSLRILAIHKCHGIRDLTWVRELPCLEEISIRVCRGVREILPTVDGLDGVNEALDCDCSSLLALRELHLEDLLSLKSISRLPMLFPSLEVLRVYGCPRLKKLPLGPRSAKNIKLIGCEQHHWERLEWYQDEDGQSVKSFFLPFYQVASETFLAHIFALKLLDAEE